MKSDLLERPTACNEALQLKSALSAKKPDFWLRKDIQSTSRDCQDIADIDYSQFRDKLIHRKDHNSTFQRGNNFIVSGNNS